MAPASVGTSKIEWDCKMHLGVSPCLERVSTNSSLSERCFKRISVTYGLSVFQTGVFILGPGARESVCKPFQDVSVPYSTVVFLDIIPLVFKARPFGGSSLLFRIYGLGWLMWNIDPWILRRKICIRSLTVVRWSSWNVFCLFLWDHVSASPICFSAALFSFAVDALFIQFSGHLQRKMNPYVIVNLCQCEDISSGCSYNTILNFSVLFFYVRL